MSDVYDRAIEYLSDHPNKIFEAWNRPFDHPGGCLFFFVTRSGMLEGSSGCLTQIRSDPDRIAKFPELTKRIREDERLPTSVDFITVKDLPLFAEWQRKIDAELGRKVDECNDQDGGFICYTVGSM